MIHVCDNTENGEMENKTGDGKEEKIRETKAVEWGIKKEQD